MSQELKADGGKARPDLLEVDFCNALRLVQATLEYGALKYSEGSWRAVPDGVKRYDAAARRHKQERDRALSRCAWSTNVLIEDDESHLPHIAHEIVCKLMQIELFLQPSGEGVMPAKDVVDAIVAGMNRNPPQGHKKGTEE